MPIMSKIIFHGSTGHGIGWKQLYNAIVSANSCKREPYIRKRSRRNDYIFADCMELLYDIPNWDQLDIVNFRCTI